MESAPKGLIGALNERSRTIFSEIVNAYLESGELVKIFDAPIDDGRDYYLCVRQNSDMTEDGKLLQAWLRRAAGSATV